MQELRRLGNYENISPSLIYSVGEQLYTLNDVEYETSLKYIPARYLKDIPAEIYIKLWEDVVRTEPIAKMNIPVNEEGIFLRDYNETERLFQGIIHINSLPFKAYKVMHNFDVHYVLISKKSIKDTIILSQRKWDSYMKEADEIKEDTVVFLHRNYYLYVTTIDGKKYYMILTPENIKRKGVIIDNNNNVVKEIQEETSYKIIWRNTTC